MALTFLWYCYLVTLVCHFLTFALSPLLPHSSSFSRSCWQRWCSLHWQLLLSVLHLLVSWWVFSLLSIFVPWSCDHFFGIIAVTDIMLFSLLTHPFFCHKINSCQTHHTTHIRTHIHIHKHAGEDITKRNGYRRLVTLDFNKNTNTTNPNTDQPSTKVPR